MRRMGESHASYSRGFSGFALKGSLALRARGELFLILINVKKLTFSHIFS